MFFGDLALFGWKAFSVSLAQFHWQSNCNDDVDAAVILSVTVKSRIFFAIATCMCYVEEKRCKRCVVHVFGCWWMHDTIFCVVVSDNWCAAFCIFEHHVVIKAEKITLRPTSIAREFIPFTVLWAGEGQTQVNQHTTRCRLDGWFNLTSSAFNRLKLAPVLVAGPAAMQNSPFLPQRMKKSSPVLIAPTHRELARLNGLDG